MKSRRLGCKSIGAEEKRAGDKRGKRITSSQQFRKSSLSDRPVRSEVPARSVTFGDSRRAPRAGIARGVGGRCSPSASIDTPRGRRKEPAATVTGEIAGERSGAGGTTGDQSPAARRAGTRAGDRSRLLTALYRRHRASPPRDTPTVIGPRVAVSSRVT